MPPQAREYRPTGEQISAFRAMVRAPDFKKPSQPITREKILVTAEPMGYVTLVSPLIPGGITIVSGEFSSFVTSGGAVLNEHGLILPTDNEMKAAIEDGEVYHFDEQGRYSGGDLYFLMRRGEVLDISSNRYVYDETGKLLVVRHGRYNDSRPSEFRYKEEGPPEPEEPEEEIPDTEAIFDSAEKEGIDQFTQKVEGMADEQIAEWWDEIDSVISELQNDIEGGPSDIEDIKDQIKEARRDGDDASDLKEELRVFKVELKEKEKQLRKWQPFADIVKGVKDARDEIKRVAEAARVGKGVILFERKSL